MTSNESNGKPHHEVHCFFIHDIHVHITLHIWMYMYVYVYIYITCVKPRSNIYHSQISRRYFERLIGVVIR